MLLQLFLLILVSFIWLIGVSYLGYSFYLMIIKQERFVPFIPSDEKGIKMMCQAVGLHGTEKVIDVGSGWGSILFHLARYYPKLHITGIEIHPLLHWVSKMRARLFYRNNDITLIRGDAASLNYSSYDIIFLFMLSPFVNSVLVPKIERELPVGSKVVSYVFKMNSPHFKEEKVQIPTHGWRNTVYVYTKV